MIFNKNNKGQAAIEFLMTYGWMLLVVLIVGALIFSFVDFGSLLPNKIELSNNLRADPTSSIAYSQGAAAPDTNTIKVVFDYNGASKVTIAGDTTWGYLDSEVESSDCDLSNIKNVDTNINSSDTTEVSFINGQTGIATFDCDTPGINLVSGDTFSGAISINVKNAKTGLQIPSAGPIRMAITG